MVPQYEPLATLSGARDAVVSLAFSAKAKFLSAAGYSGVFVWDLSTSAAITLPHMLFAPQNPKYVITSSFWVYFQKNKCHVLLLASMRGDLILWDYKDDIKSFQVLYRVPPMENKEEEVLSMDVYEQDIASGRIGRVVAATANRHISVWSLSSSGEFSKIFSTTLDENINPKTVRMCKITRDIFVFPFYGGEILCLDYKTGAIKSRKSHGPGIMGSVALSNTSNKFVAYTGKNFHLYRLASLELLKTYSAETPVVMFSKTVAFGESENIIVGGTDRGHALIYEVNTEELLQTLTYPRGGLVQPVTTITLPDRHLIAIAGSTAQQSADVILFEKRIPLEDVSSPQLPSSASCTDVTPNHSSTDSVLIGFHLSKQIWDWARILGLMALLTFAGYYTVYQVWVF
ncbi:WD40-repeat-containing domain protein [Lentinula edodes]|uniref:WD40-repeat-containing domain protein n=1 Tax=Lentinula edodes TaxID=5353 RepID=UPI001E8E8A3A|nr:WD40-repeat-containing domain protein [Lentinula edodes]KAH7880261.1 WD40-repeat-containing domain protein [Lentinula edodes]